MAGRATANVARANAAKSALLASRIAAPDAACPVACGDRVRLSEHGRKVFRLRPPERHGVVTYVRRSGLSVLVRWDGLRSAEDMHVNYVESVK